MDVQKFTDKAILFLIIFVPCMREGFPVYFQWVLCYRVTQIKTRCAVIVLLQREKRKLAKLSGVFAWILIHCVIQSEFHYLFWAFGTNMFNKKWLWIYKSINLLSISALINCALICTCKNGGSLCGWRSIFTFLSGLVGLYGWYEKL